jgi:hypothetical protein
MYDHERSLVTEMEKAGKPFALVGVNVGDSLDRIKKAVEENELNWRSFFAGEEDSTIPDSYNVQVYPTVVIIDADGIVRSAANGPQDDVIEELLAEME